MTLWIILEYKMCYQPPRKKMSPISPASEKCCSPSCCQRSLANTPWKVWFSTGSKSYIYIYYIYIYISYIYIYIYLYIYIHICFLDAFFWRVDIGVCVCGVQMWGRSSKIACFLNVIQKSSLAMYNCVFFSWQHVENSSIKLFNCRVYFSV